MVSAITFETESGSLRVAVTSQRLSGEGRKFDVNITGLDGRQMYAQLTPVEIRDLAEALRLAMG